MQSKSTITASHENEENESMEESVFEQICDTIFVLIPEGVCTIFLKKERKKKQMKLRDFSWNTALHDVSANRLFYEFIRINGVL